MDAQSVLILILIVAVVFLPHFIVGIVAKAKLRSFWGWFIFSLLLCNCIGLLEMFMETFGIISLVIFIVLLVCANQPSDRLRRIRIIEDEKLRAAIREEQERIKEKEKLLPNSTGKTINDLYSKK